MEEDVEDVVVSVQYPEKQEFVDFARNTRQKVQAFLDGGYKNFDFPKGTRLKAVDDWGWGEILSEFTIGEDDAVHPKP